MNSNRETIFQRGPGWIMPNGLIAGPGRNFGIPGLEDDARRVGHRLPDRRVSVRATESTFGHLPPWAQPAWMRRLPR
jgi:hypothetical protein